MQSDGVTGRVMNWFPRRFLVRHHTVTFFLMGASFLLFGVITLNLFAMLKDNIDMSLQYGLMALVDGAALQLFELVLYSYLSMFFYLMFKTCERILVEGLVHPHAQDAETRQASISTAAAAEEPQRSSAR